jgi:hypothetical protein
VYRILGKPQFRALPCGLAYQFARQHNRPGDLVKVEGYFPGSGGFFTLWYQCDDKFQYRVIREPKE